MLLSIDTLRADHVGAYGYERDTSPNLDAFAARSVRYAWAFAPAPWTLPSHVAMLTGRHPYDAGIDTLESAIPGGVPLVAERLAASGYRTAAFVDSSPQGLLGAERGFGRGFASFEHAPHRAPDPYKYDMAATVDAALAWLDGRDADDRNAPFFLFLHTKSVHTTPAGDARARNSDAPYDKPEPFGTRFLPDGRRAFAWSEGAGIAGVRYLSRLNDRIAAGRMDPARFPRDKLAELVALYDGGIAYVDLHFQRLLDGLARRGLSDDTVIVVASDHGEAFLDHRFFLHAETFASTLHVPLVVHDPRQTRPVVVDEPVTLMRIAPTLLALAGLAAPAAMAPGPLPGIERIADAVTDAGRVGETRRFSYYRMKRGGFYEAYAITDGRFRLVLDEAEGWSGRRVALFDAEADPREANPVDDRDAARALLGALEDRLATREDAPAWAPTIDLAPDTVRQLIELGYADDDPGGPPGAGREDGRERDDAGGEGD